MFDALQSLKEQQTDPESSEALSKAIDVCEIYRKDLKPEFGQLSDFEMKNE